MDIEIISLKELNINIKANEDGKTMIKAKHTIK